MVNHNGDLGDVTNISMRINKSLSLQFLNSDIPFVRANIINQVMYII